MFAVGMMLFAFQFFTETELQFAALGRNSTQALNLAEAGIAESLTASRLSGAIPGATSFTNSLARTLSGTSGTVAHESCLPGSCLGNPTIFPILSTATFGGAQRKIRVMERATFKPGFGALILAPWVSFSGDASQFTGDTYAVGNVAGGGAPGGVTFQSYAKSPRGSTSAMGTTLLPPEVMSGTTIALGNGLSGRQIDANCPPGLLVRDSGTFTWECAVNALAEVPPTSCPGLSNRRLVPYNWHPMTPIGMPSVDFTAIVTASTAARMAAGILVMPATQDGTRVTYSPAGTYTPSYWTGSPPGPVLLVVASQPFCVNPSAAANAVMRVNVPFPGSCPPGYAYYGASLNIATGLTTRYIDWGLVQDDLSRSRAALFFQASAIPPDPTAPTCSGSSGNLCGIRYIPLLPPIDVVAQACTATAFDQVNTQDGAACSGNVSPQADVTFTGTKSNPETLVINNAGSRAPVHVSFSLLGADVTSSQACGDIHFGEFNYGIILAQGDLVLTGNSVFSGFIYTTGTITFRGTFAIRGGVFAASLQAQGGTAHSVNSMGAMNFCAGSKAPLPVSPQFFDFQTVSWQEVPLNQR